MNSMATALDQLACLDIQVENEHPNKGAKPASDQGAYDGALPERSSQQLSKTAADDPPRDKTDEIGNKNDFGTAYIHADLELHRAEEIHEELKLYEVLFKNLGLETRIKFGDTPATISTLVSDKSPRRIHVFLILAGASSKENPTEFATTLDGVLVALREKCNAQSPKLLVFCRLKDPTDPIPEITKETAIFNTTELDWKQNHPNVAVIYKCGDESNIFCFLKNLRERIEHTDDPKNPGSCAPVTQIVSQLQVSSTKKQFHHRGLEGNTDLRIEAFKFEERLWQNHPNLKDQSGFSPLTVPDMDNCYPNNGDGRVLIISNEKFVTQSRRRGTRLDCENLKYLFRRLGFEEQNIDVRHDLKSSEMMNAVEEFSAQDCGSCAILVILTHGSEGRLYGVEEAFITVQAVIDAFSTASGLSRKPKLLIINACRNPVSSESSSVKTGTSDCAQIDKSKQNFAAHFLASKLAVVTDHSPHRAGLIVAYSTLPGEECSGLPYSGSRLISSLCWVLHHHAGQEDVLTMINRVNDHITGFKQTGTNSTTGKQEETRMQLPSWEVETTKKFYLVKVAPAAGGPQTGSQELQCPLAVLSCSFSTTDARLLAAHHEDSAEHHRELCARYSRELTSTKADIEKKSREISILRDQVNELKMKHDESQSRASEL